MRIALLVVSVVVVMTAGCASTDGPTTTPSDPSTTNVETTEPAPVSSLDLASSGVACGDDLSVGFWGLTHPPGAWDQNLVRVGYYVPPNASFLVVTYVDGSPEGFEYETDTRDDGAHVDGAKLHLNTSFSDEHTVEAVLYHDENGNGRFERGVDSPCLSGGEPVTTGPERVNFSKFE